MMTLWTDFKQLHSASDETLGPNEEEEVAKKRFLDGVGGWGAKYKI